MITAGRSRSKRKSKKPKKKPLQQPVLKAHYYGVKMLFDGLEESYRKMAIALKGPVAGTHSPSDFFFYKDDLATLVRLEAQADVLVAVFALSRNDIKKWLVDMEAWFKTQEKIG